MAKHVLEDWSHFNNAVLKRAGYAPAPVATKVVRSEVVASPRVARQPPMPPQLVPPPQASTAARSVSNVWGLIWLGLALILLIMILGALFKEAPTVLPISSSVLTDPASPSAGTVNPTRATSVVTNYTTFKSVDFMSGVVVTGWAFGSNRDAAPQHQYCYYLRNESATKVDLKFDLQNAGKPVQPFPLSDKLDLTPAQWQQAASSCIWWSGSSPNPSTSDPDARRT
jgi:hypothetical protein